MISCHIARESGRRIMPGPARLFRCLLFGLLLAAPSRATLAQEAMTPGQIGTRIAMPQEGGALPGVNYPTGVTPPAAVVRNEVLTIPVQRDRERINYVYLGGAWVYLDPARRYQRAPADILPLLEARRLTHVNVPGSGLPNTVTPQARVQTAANQSRVTGGQPGLSNPPHQAIVARGYSHPAASFGGSFGHSSGGGSVRH